MTENINEPRPDSNEVEIDAFGWRKTGEPDRERYAVYFWLAERSRELDRQAKDKERPADVDLHHVDKNGPGFQ